MHVPPDPDGERNRVRLGDIIEGDALTRTQGSDVLSLLDALRDESDRVEFKSTAAGRGDRKKIAYAATCLANARGGIIVVGLKDPTGTAPLEFAPIPVASRNRDLIAITGAISALSYPSVYCEAFAFEGELNSTTCPFIVIRVPATRIGPHEYLGSDAERLPMRNGAQGVPMSLSQIEALQLARRTTHATGCPREQHAVISEIMGFVAPLRMIGTAARAIQAAQGARTPDASDDEALKEIVSYKCFGLSPQSWRILPDGISFNGSTQADDIAGAIFSDGDLALRSPLTPDHSLYQLGNALGNLYVLVSRSYHHFGLPPRALVKIKLVIPPSAQGTYGGPKLASAEHEHVVDVSDGLFVKSIRDVAMQVLRSGGVSVTKGELESALAAAWAELNARNPDLSELWD